MAVSAYNPTDTGYTQSIRQNLVGQGVKDSDIGYNGSTGYVTVSGKDAIKAPKTYNGTSYTNQQGFNDDWAKYQKSLQPTPVVNNGAPVTTPTTTPNSYDPYKTSNPYDTQLNDMLKSLMEQAKNPTPVDVNAIYNSPQYAAYQAQAQKSAQQGIRAAQESLGSAGFGRSTALGERSQGIQNDATEYLNTQVLPQLMSQEQASRQQQLQNQFTALDQLMGQQGVYDNRFNNANQFALNKGELTGKFLDPQAASLIDQILQQKQAYGSATTQQDRSAANQNATSLRNQLAAMGVDPSSFGANRTLEQAQSGMSNAGVKTLNAKNQEYNQMADARDFEYTSGRDKVKDAQFEAEFQQRVKNDGIQNAISWANNALSAQDNELSRDKFEYDKTQDSANSGGNPKNYNYKNDPSFASEVQWINENPDKALKEITSKSAKIISQYGKDAYDDLVGYATPKKKSTSDLFSEMFSQ